MSLSLCGEQEGGLLPAVSMPEIVFSLGLCAWSTGLCLPALDVPGKPQLARHGRSCTQPALLAAASSSFGGDFGSSQQATHFLAFLKGGCSVLAGVLGSSFPLHKQR